ncbi:MAG: PAS domain S-box protein, partial [Desulfomonilaceae bacterium]
MSFGYEKFGNLKSCDSDTRPSDSDQLNPSETRPPLNNAPQEQVDYKALYENTKALGELYLGFLKASTDSIVVYDTKGHVKFFNNRFTKIFGWAIQELSGHRVPFVPESEAALTIATINRLYQGGEPSVTFDTKRLTKSGDLLDVNISASCYRDAHGEIAGMLAILRDVTDRKQVIDALKSSEENYRAIFNAVEDAIFIHDIDTGKVQDINSRVTELYGYAKSEALTADLSLISVIDEGYTPEKALERIHRAAQGHPQSFEWRALTKSGHRLWVEVSLSLVNLGGRPNVIALVRDITKRKKAEEILLHSELLKAVAELATGVAHNFNNVLQKILVSSQSALIKLDQGDPSATRPFLMEIAQNSRNGSETVKRLQSFAQLRSDVTSETDQIFDLTKAVRDALEMSELLWRTLAAKNGVSISIEPDITDELMVSGISNDMFEVTLNLMRNSIDAVSNGGRIRVRTFPRDDYAILEVEDDGTGISPENLSKIFDPFFTTKGLQSTGMGLASVYGIVASHGGSISVDS